MARSRVDDEAARAGGGFGPIPPFQAFLDANRAIVYRFLLASVGPVEADDVFQETFLAALRAYPKLRDASNLRGWVLTIATRKAIDAGRARARRALPVAEPAEASDPPTIEATVALDGRAPLWRELRDLPARQRAAVVHRVILDQTYAAVAGAMGSTEETARANVYQGLKKLRERLGGP